MRKPISICHRCEQMESACHGSCACMVDMVDISLHAESSECPLGKFSSCVDALVAKMPSRRPSIPLAGDILEAAIKRIGADRLAKWWTKRVGNCGCSARKEKINAADRKLRKWLGM